MARVSLGSRNSAAVLVFVVAISLTMVGCGGGSSPTATKAMTQQNAGTSSVSTPTTAQEASKADAPKAQQQAKEESPPVVGSGKRGPHVPVPKGKLERGQTPAEEKETTEADISLTSPALAAAGGTVGGALPRSYTCDGEGKWPAFQWQGLPSNTAELVLFAMNAAPVEGKLFFDWAVAGIDPSSSGLEAGKLPAGAFLGRNSYGRNAYEICPPAGKGETYVFLLFALPKRLSSHTGFDARDLRDRAQQLSRKAGLLAATYVRG